MRRLKGRAPRPLSVPVPASEPAPESIVWVQKWEESEAGWGTRPDGYTLHKTREDIDGYVHEMRAQELKGRPAGYVPEEYSRPAGKPYQARVTPELAAKVAASGSGMPGDFRTAEPPPLISGADQTGWVRVLAAVEPPDARLTRLEKAVAEAQRVVTDAQKEIAQLRGGHK